MKPALFRRFVDIGRKKPLEAVASAGAGIPLLAAPVMLENDRHVHTNQRANIGRQCAVGSENQHVIEHSSETCADLRDTLIHTPHVSIDCFEQFDLAIVTDARQRIGRRAAVASVNAAAPSLR